MTIVRRRPVITSCLLAACLALTATAASSMVTGELDSQRSTQLATPSVRSLPQLGGRPSQGTIISTSPGKWKGTIISFEYGWLRCDESGAACVLIAGHTRPTYRISKADVGRGIRSLVIAHGLRGQRAVASFSSQPVTRKTRTRPVDRRHPGTEAAPPAAQIGSAPAPPAPAASAPAPAPAAPAPLLLLRLRHPLLQLPLIPLRRLLLRLLHPPRLLRRRRPLKLHSLASPGH